MCDPDTALNAGSNIMANIQLAVIKAAYGKHSIQHESEWPLRWQRCCRAHLCLPLVPLLTSLPVGGVLGFLSASALDCGICNSTVSLLFWNWSLSPHQEAFLWLLFKNLSSSCVLYAQDSRCRPVLSWTTKLHQIDIQSNICIFPVRYLM